jgi:hypothetical protein
MTNPIRKHLARWYYRNVYRPEPVDALPLAGRSPEHHLTSVPWISVREALCQSVALQMIAACHGIERPRRHFDFLMGFTYGASQQDQFGLMTVGTDPETGLLTAAPYLGLLRRYYFTDDAARYLAALRAFLSQGHPVRVPLDMGALYGQAESLPHNEVLVGYDPDGLYYYEPVSRPPAPSQPGHLPPGERGLYVADDRLLHAVSRESGLFGYPWRYPFVIFEPSLREDDLGAVWRQDGQALVGGDRWGQKWGAAAIEQQAAEIDRLGTRFDCSRVALALEVGAATRPDNAAYLRETFGNRADLMQAADLLDSAAASYWAAQEAAEGATSEAAMRDLASGLRKAAAAERRAGEIFLAQVRAA